MTLIGIDLGTTHSLVGVWSEGEAQLIPNSLGSYLTPSVVGVDEDGRMLVGQAARDRLVSHPDLTAASYKRDMGTDKVRRLGKHALRPEELSSFVLRSLKADAEAHLKQPVERAVISVPAYFGEAQRRATRVAGEMAGLEVARLINEPTAAALAYGLHEAPDESTFLVFDLGGGTFDVSILELFEGVMEVRASAGDCYLGGDDFNAAIQDAVLADAKLALRDLSPTERGRLWRQVELAKHELTKSGKASIALPAGGREIAFQLDSARLEKLAEPLIERMRAPVERALRDARLKLADLDSVVLVGGATRMPIVRSVAARLFGRLPLSNVHPDEVVGRGAAVQAGLVARDAALSEVVMTDTAPYSLGVGISVETTDGGLFHNQFDPIIPRNTVIPVSREKTYCTMTDRQTQIALTVYQGESRLVEHNIKLGELRIRVPKAPRGEQTVDVRFTYDTSGLLEVHTRVASTGTEQRLIIEQQPGQLTPDEVAARLAKLAVLKIHPREEMKNRAEIARAERLYEERLDMRELLQRWTAEFESVLGRQDLSEIDRARVKFAALLDQVEGQGSPL
jgi:molecular chaperone HscC